MRRTDTEHADKNNLGEAEKQISEVTRKVNEFLRKSETDSEMLKLFERGPRFQVTQDFPAC